MGIIAENASNSTSWRNFLLGLFDFSRISIMILWGGALLVIIIWGISLAFSKIRLSKKAEAQFRKIMKEHTYHLLNKSEIGGYSWGYNKNMFVSKNPTGWRPEDIYIDLKNSEVESLYEFPTVNADLRGYDKNSYNSYCENSEKIDTIRQRGDDRERYAVKHVERTMKNNRVEIRLQKTGWSQLQFSWDYLRRLQTNNEPVCQTQNDLQIEDKFVKALNHDEDLLINSFCLHLVLISKNGKAILSKISRVKSNDYPATWAATIGEQLEKRDFVDDKGEVYSDFVVRWVKRALDEEFGINENLTDEKEISELEEYVDMNSLRVLSVDFEGDIYNVALTCVVKLKIDADTLSNLKEIQIDGNENTKEFIECSEADVRRILLDYPNNKNLYHPSTYLRLLMYHLYCCKQAFTMSSFLSEHKKKSKQK